MIPLAVPILLAMGRVSPQRPNRQQIDEHVIVEFVKETATTSPRGFVFQDAQVEYETSVLTADKVTVDLEEGHKHFLAEGHVHILDIDGSLDADSLDVNWVEKTGSGSNVHIKIQGFMVHADALHFQEKHADLEGVFATPCDNDSTTLIAIRARRATIDPNIARIYHPSLYLLGQKVLTLREYDISPNRRSTGQPIPSPGYSRSSGFSVGWVPGIMLSDTLAVNGSIHLGQNSYPSEDILISKSLLTPTQAVGGIVPYNQDFGEHFGFSYFDNVYVADPISERFFVSGRRESISLGSVWREDPGARPVSNALNQPVDLIYEAAGSVVGLGTYAQLRAERTEQIGGPSENRLETFTSVALPDYDIVKHLYTDVRFDGYSSLGTAKPYGWGHAQIGLVAKPSKELRLGVAYMKAGNYGTPLFFSDEIYRLNSVNFRGDLMLGPREISVLLKYDPLVGDWYDTEFKLSQAVGCLEPYLIYRAFPRGLVFGLSLRIDDLMNTLKRRGVVKSGQLGDEDR
jgi:hypothetical protein